MDPFILLFHESCGKMDGAYGKQEVLWEQQQSIKERLAMFYWMGE
jgi:hypothetical protein